MRDWSVHSLIEKSLKVKFKVTIPINKKIAVGGWMINVDANNIIIDPFLIIGLTGYFLAIIDSVRNTNEMAKVEG
jgi:hypothetical protein